MFLHACRVHSISPPASWRVAACSSVTDHQAVASQPWTALAAQDVVAGDGTTSVTVICGALLKKCLDLLERGIHPTVISDAFAAAAEKAVQILEAVAIPVDLDDRAALIKAANTCAARLCPCACDVPLQWRSEHGRAAPASYDNDGLFVNMHMHAVSGCAGASECVCKTGLSEHAVQRPARVRAGGAQVAEQQGRVAVLEPAVAHGGRLRAQSARPRAPRVVRALRALSARPLSACAHTARAMHGVVRWPAR